MFKSPLLSEVIPSSPWLNFYFGEQTYPKYSIEALDIYFGQHREQAMAVLIRINSRKIEYEVGYLSMFKYIVFDRKPLCVGSKLILFRNGGLERREAYVAALAPSLHDLYRDFPNFKETSLIRYNKRFDVDKEETDNQTPNVKTETEPIVQQRPIRPIPELIPINAPQVPALERLPITRLRPADNYPRWVEERDGDVDYVLTDGENVYIGENQTAISRRNWENVNWKKPSTAVRSLLRAKFNREYLATHSLTGQESNAFKNMNKEPRPQMEPSITSDIVSLVAWRFKLTPTIIHREVTSLLADEHKRYVATNAQRRVENV